MLVRKEYFTALQALNTNRYRRGAYITGQPGIGKTLFLIYLLVKHLGQEQPVAVQFTFFNNTFYVLFKDSTASFHVLHDIEPLFHCGPMWALCSSSDEFSSPSKVFYGHMSHIKTIQVTPFKSKHWRNWSEKASAVCYIMDIWSEREIKDLGKLFKQDVDHMTALAKKWGCIPETVLQTIHGNRDSTIEAEHYAYAPKAVRRCQEILSATQMNDLPNDALSQFYFVQPRQDSELGRIHTDACACVPTFTVRHILAKALKTQSHSVRLQFFNAMNREGTRLTGNHIYENWFHSYFSTAIERIECYWIQGLSGTAQLRGVRSLVRYDESTLEAREPPYYWVAPKGFPGLSSALVLQDEIFAFRTTINRKRKLPTRGLRRLRDSLPADLKDVQWRMILVGMDKGAIKAVARRWTGKICFPGENMHVPIGWCQVDPVTWGFKYKVRERLIGLLSVI
ncbi:hypothetical protein EV363DRAFT_1271018 [Boletus edulis]|nr:hypothetical protein EV363DRAFT_1271018 [Boletus edulis]